jgi:hypothetical protein
VCIVAGYKQVYGKTWDVYHCILTSSEPIGVREIWRKLGLSTPSLTQNHVNKLLELELIESTSQGEYITNDVERNETLKNFLALRGLMIPRMVVYSALLSGILLSYLTFWPWRGDFRDLMVLAVTLFSISTFLFEAVKQYWSLSAWKGESYRLSK